jgi:23S rRNA pseudouridine1911/1915/1917 synthase
MWHPEIVYEDNHILAVCKQPGDISQGDRTGDEALPDQIKSYIKKRDDKPGNVYLGVVHRLDRPVSGIILFAKTSKALDRLNKLFRERTVQKTYLAITSKRPSNPDGVLEHYLVKDPKRNTSRICSKTTSGAKQAKLSYRLIQSLNAGNLIEVKPYTGRPHQIRVQLASMGCPIIGDLRYGAKKPNNDASICLHAYKLEFIHPVRKEPLTLRADIPENNIWRPFDVSDL